MKLQTRIHDNLKAQLEHFEELLVLAGLKEQLLLSETTDQGAEHLKEVNRRESLTISAIEDLEKVRRELFGARRLKDLLDLSLAENQSVAELAEALRTTGEKLREQNRRNNEALKFSVRLVNKLVRAVQDLHSGSDMTYSRLRRRPGKSFGGGLSLSI